MLAHVGWICREKSDIVSVILGHLPTHRLHILVSGSRIWRIYQTPVFDKEIVLRKKKVRQAYLLLENEPVISHRLSFVIISNTMIREVIRNDLLSFTSDLLPCQSDRWYPILLRRLEETIQPGEKAQPK
jgi:hypothetical protein